MNFKAFAGKALSLAAATVVLASCYLPARFDAEIELDKAGYYSMKFDGYLADVDLYRGLKDGKISPAEEKEKMAVIERDFARDASTKEYQYYREGHFRVKWERAGDLLKAKTVTFIRRNELIFQLKYVENSGYIVLEGKSITKENRQRIQQMGLGMQGQIRVKTDLPVKSHNATSEKKDPRDPRFKWLVWDIASIMSPRPRAVFIIE
ncbi:hypothetical protein [Magnetovibrio sp.]|uniref:hypothetical protein n=1 Tax=Magnetovibrio sp. TaxID=2024836 RepID=UPI002F95D52C